MITNENDAVYGFLPEEKLPDGRIKLQLKEASAGTDDETVSTFYVTKEYWNNVKKITNEIVKYAGYETRSFYFPNVAIQHVLLSLGNCGLEGEINQGTISDNTPYLKILRDIAKELARSQSALSYSEITPALMADFIRRANNIPFGSSLAAVNDKSDKGGGASYVPDSKPSITPIVENVEYDGEVSSGKQRERYA